MLVELHWSLVELPFYIETHPMDEIWRTAAPAPALLGACLPDPPTLLLHSCAHWALHHSQEQRLLWLLDIDRLARWDRLDWSLVLERATRWRLQLALRTLVQQSETGLGTPIPPAVKQAMAQWQPASVETAMWGLGDEPAGTTPAAHTYHLGGHQGGQRRRYAGWLGLCKLISYPEKVMLKWR